MGYVYCCLLYWILKQNLKTKIYKLMCLLAFTGYRPKRMNENDKLFSISIGILKNTKYYWICLHPPVKLI